MSTYDVVDDNNRLTGRTATYDQVHSQGLWHRSVHVIIYTPDNMIVMQKRSPSLKVHPGEIEISAGGGVDSGETPAKAGVREILEELGIRLVTSRLHLIGITKYNHRNRTQINRQFIYSYSVCLPAKDLHFTQNNEVDSIFMISRRQLYRAISLHRIRHAGRLAGQYAYWRMLVDSLPTAIESAG